MKALADLSDYLAPFGANKPKPKARTARWDSYFMNIALATAHMSKDPSTQVGAVLVGKSKDILATGYNGFPEGVEDDKRLYDRRLKNQMVVHAEMNIIANAAKRGVRLEGSTLYLIATNNVDLIWGGPPCAPCCAILIQAGIKEVVSFPMFNVPERWKESVLIGLDMLNETGVKYREIPTTRQKTVLDK